MLLYKRSCHRILSYDFVLSEKENLPFIVKLLSQKKTSSAHRKIKLKRYLASCLHTTILGETKSFIQQYTMSGIKNFQILKLNITGLKSRL